VRELVWSRVGLLDPRLRVPSSLRDIYILCINLASTSSCLQNLHHFFWWNSVLVPAIRDVGTQGMAVALIPVFCTAGAKWSETVA